MATPKDPNTKQVQLYLDRDTDLLATTEAAKEGISKSAYITRLIHAAQEPEVKPEAAEGQPLMEVMSREPAITVWGVNSWSLDCRLFMDPMIGRRLIKRLDEERQGSHLGEAEKLAEMVNRAVIWMDNELKTMALEKSMGITLRPGRRGY